MEISMTDIGRTIRKKVRALIIIRMEISIRVTTKKMLNAVMVLPLNKIIGELFYTNGDKHEGEYAKDLKNGKGKQGC
jgi:hypothetical protein